MAEKQTYQPSAHGYKMQVMSWDIADYNEENRVKMLNRASIRRIQEDINRIARDAIEKAESDGLKGADADKAVQAVLDAYAASVNADVNFLARGRAPGVGRQPAIKLNPKGEAQYQIYIKGFKETPMNEKAAKVYGELGGETPVSTKSDNWTAVKVALRERLAANPKFAFKAKDAEMEEI